MLTSESTPPYLTTEKPRLFHSTASAKDESGNYILYPDRLVPMLNTTGNGEITDKLVFATDDLREAPAYALKARASDRGVAQVQSSGLFAKIPTAFMYDPHGKFPDQHPNGKIFEVNSESFEPVLQDGAFCGEWISREEVSMKEVQEITPRFAMESGTQFFTYTDMSIYEEWRTKRNELLKELGPDGDQLFIFKLIGKFIEEGKLRFVNQELEINPVNLSTGLLEDMRFIEDPQLILADRKAEAAKSIETSSTKKSWIERMREDKTKGKSLGGSNEV